MWALSWRLAVATLLLVWILHSIFLNETRQAWTGPPWDQLSRSQQWREAWVLGPHELWRTLYLVHPGSMLASLVLMGMTILIGVFRWRMVLRIQGLNLRFDRAAEISLVAHFFNSFLLGSTGGDLLKAYYAARETHHKKTEAVTTVFVDRLIGLFAMLFFAGIFMIPNWRLIVLHHRFQAVTSVILMMWLACTAVVAVMFWGGLSRYWPGAREWLRRLPKGDLVEKSVLACRRFGQERKFLAQALGVSMILNLVCVLQVLVLASGLGLRIPSVALFLIVPMIICISALPITPSGLGVRENLYVWMLAAPQIHVEPTKALSLSLLAYAGSLFWSVVGGLVYITLRESHHLADISAEDEPASNH
jgi:uncharacterized protein (TIRG00374 family)